MRCRERLENPNRTSKIVYNNLILLSNIRGCCAGTHGGFAVKISSNDKVYRQKNKTPLNQRDMRAYEPETAAG